MVDYNSVYVRDNFLKNRIVPEPNQEAKEHLADLSQDIDSIIDNLLRAHLGTHDKNDYEILLPLSGTKNVIDFDLKTVTLKMEPTIQKVADDYVIAEYRRDSSESIDRLEQARKDLQTAIERLYGVSISSVRQDFATEFLAANKVGSENGEILGDSTNQILLVHSGTEPRIP